MQMKFAAIATLSTVASATLFAAPAQAAPGVPFPIPGHGHELKLGPAKHFAKQNLADGDWVQTVRDGKTLYSRSTPVTVSPTSGPRSGTRSDFDGDGRDDLAVGSSAGVIVNYSSAAHRDQFATEAIGDELVYFGNSVVSGNFNGDGYDDLVIADVGEVDTATKGLTAGAIWIFYGSADGLLIDSVQHLNQSSPDVPGASETDDFFGGALAAGDITGDGVDDLAVGLPGESLGTAIGTGGIIVFQGSGSGVVTAGSQWIDQNTTARARQQRVRRRVRPVALHRQDQQGWVRRPGRRLAVRELLRRQERRRHAHPVLGQRVRPVADRRHVRHR